MKHPVRRDRLRFWLDSLSILSLIAIFVVVTALFAAGVSLALTLVNLEGGTFSGALFKDVLFAVFDRMLGQSPGYNIMQLDYGETASLATSLYFIIVPTLFLGSVLYKFTNPRTGLMIFRDKLHIDEARNCLVGDFYISTDMKVHDLNVSCFFKYYRPNAVDGSENAYPLFTRFAANGARYLPLPFKRVPVQVNAPVKVMKSQADLNRMQVDYAAMKKDEDELEGRKTGLIAIREVEGGYSVWADGEEVDPDKGEFCELYIVVECRLPRAQSDILEIKKYDLHRDVKTAPPASFEPRFDVDSREYKVRAWRNF